MYIMSSQSVHLLLKYLSNAMNMRFPSFSILVCFVHTVRITRLALSNIIFIMFHNLISTTTHFLELVN